MLRKAANDSADSRVIGYSKGFAVLVISLLLLVHGIPALAGSVGEAVFQEVTAGVVVVKTYGIRKLELTQSGGLKDILSSDKPKAQGSGVVTAPHTVLTNCHVIPAGWRIEIEHRGVIMTTENSPASMVENSPTPVKVFDWVLGRDRRRGRGGTEGARRATGVPPLPQKNSTKSEDRFADANVSHHSS